MAEISIEKIGKVFHDKSRGRDVAALDDISLSIAANDLWSSDVTIEIAVPARPARPVRPMRWTYVSGSWVRS